MSLSSLQLDAFTEVARRGSFSDAAERLHITQSALSQRILNLESELGSTLFIRESSGIRLTDLGQRLLRYCQARESLEGEFMQALKSKESSELAGLVRVAGFSTVVRSVLIPALADLGAKNPSVQLEIMSKELREIPSLLETGQCEFALLSRPLDRHGLESQLLGHEENVLVQAKGKKTREGVFLDHDEDDTMTIEYLKHQGRGAPKLVSRSYLDEIYALIDGVLAGLGRAVVPLHIARSIKGLEIVPGQKPLRSPVYLVYYHQAFFTSLQSAVIETLREKVPALLGD